MDEIDKSRPECKGERRWVKAPRDVGQSAKRTDALGPDASREVVDIDAVMLTPRLACPRLRRRWKTFNTSSPFTSSSTEMTTRPGQPGE